MLCIMNPTLVNFSLLFYGAALAAQPLIHKPLTEAERASLAYTLAHYTKYEYRIPMRDGVRLFAAVYIPKDASQPYPIIMQRTPYNVGPYGADNYKTQVGPSIAAEKEAFIFVYEDVRGRYMSEGVFVDVPPHKTHYDGPKDTDESTDTWDTNRDHGRKTARHPAIEEKIKSDLVAPSIIQVGSRVPRVH